MDGTECCWAGTKRGWDRKGTEHNALLGRQQTSHPALESRKCRSVGCTSIPILLSVSASLLVLPLTERIQFLRDGCPKGKVPLEGRRPVNLYSCTSVSETCFTLE